MSILKEVIVYDDYNSNIRKDQDTIGTLTQNCGASALRNGWKLIESVTDFEFPEKQELSTRLKDILEPEVDEKFYIKDAESLTLGSNFDIINGGSIGKMHDISRRAYHTDSVAPAMHTCGGGNQEPKITEPSGGGLCIRTATKKGYDMAIEGDGIDLAYPQSKTRRGRVGHGVSKTLMGTDSMGTLQNCRIRKLTPKECWRLMGFADEDFEKAKSSGVSNSQLYKQAGNSIVVDVLEGILGNLFGDER